MSFAMFELAVKSTLDYYCNQIAQEWKDSGDPELAGLLADGLDNLVTIDSTVKNQNPAILWEFQTFSPMPRDPLYTAQLSVGVKTTLDDANYLQSKIVSMLSSRFAVESNIPVYDYSVASDELAAQPSVGMIYITDSTSTPMQFDNQSGLKLISLSARLMRYV